MKSLGPAPVSTALVLGMALVTTACPQAPADPGDPEEGGSSGTETGGKTGEGTGGKGTTGGTGGKGTGGSDSTGGAGGKGTGGSDSTGGAGGKGTGGSDSTGGSGTGGSDSTGGTGGAGTGGAGSGGAGAGGADAGSPDMAPTTGGPFTIKGDFLDKGTYLCFKKGNTRNTGQKSPEITWTGVPAGTKSLAVSLKDLSNDGVHWVAWNLPATATGLPAGLPATALPAGASQDKEWYGPGADLHKYEYQVWALKTEMLPAKGAKGTMYDSTFPMQKLESAKILVCGDAGGACADCSKK
jgi:Raf kinase inhibitor-like YbhB/YbcL family protein